jgi:hypothetical protein
VEKAAQKVWLLLSFSKTAKVKTHVKLAQIRPIWSPWTAATF